MRRLITALAVLAVLATAASLTAAQSPADRCRAAGYSAALHIVQPDGVTREWLCYSLPAADLSTPYRIAYLKETS